MSTGRIVVKPVRSGADAADAARLMHDLMAANIALYPEWRARIMTTNAERWFMSDRALPDPAYRLPQGDVLVARLDDAAVGAAAWTRLGGHGAELQSLFVADTARRQGIAAALSEAVVQSAREAGILELVLYTGKRQTGAQALYDRLGWRRIEPYEAEPKPGRIYYAISLTKARAHSRQKERGPLSRGSATVPADRRWER